MGAAELPDQFHWICLKQRIRRHNRPAFLYALCNEDSVERIPVMGRKLFQARDVVEHDRKDLDVVVRELFA